MNNYTIVGVLFVALTLPSLAAGQQGGTVAGADSAYAIQPGDVLEVSVWKEPDLQREVVVQPDGAFAFPLVGVFDARGKTIDQIRTEITERLTEFIPELVVTVMVKEVQGNRIYVIGQVTRPGSYVVNPSVDVVQALSLAGGTTPFAGLDKIRILRRENGTQTAIPFNYEEVSNGRLLDQNVILKPGDVVLVP